MCIRDSVAQRNRVHKHACCEVLELFRILVVNLFGEEKVDTIKTTKFVQFNKEYIEQKLE